MSEPVAIPESYLAMPRWWHEGEDWLAALPATIADACGRWRLALDGDPMHGSNALVLPVRRAGVPLALRLTPPDDGTVAEVRALRFWAGRGVVRLVEADPGRGLSLLERLHGEETLAIRPLAEAMPVIARLLRRLAVPDPPPEVPSTADLVRERLETMPVEWERLGEPFDRGVLDVALEAGESLREPAANLAVNGDLHCEQVLRADRDDGWLVVDPVLLRGDPVYDLARVLWTRLDEMPDAAAIRHWLRVLVTEAGLDPDRALAGVRFRTVDYWLWGLSYGLTEDPVRCARLVDAL
jgi:streptomycin 6-kinase